MSEGFLPPVVAVLKGNIEDFSAKMGEARAEMRSTEKQGHSSFKKIGAIGKAALFGVAAGAVAVGALSLKMADTYEKAHARLSAAVVASGHQLSQFTGIISKQSSGFENLGYTNAQYEEALARLTQATNDPAKALARMSLVANIARARNIDLTAAATLVGKVMQGNTGILKRFGIDLGIAGGGAAKTRTAYVALGKAQQKLGDVTRQIHEGHLKGEKAALAYRNAIQAVAAKTDALKSASAAGKDAVDALTKRFGGAAAAQAETFSGKMAALKAKSEDLFKNIGLKLIPVLEKLADITLKIIKWFERHKTATKVLVIALAALAAALLVAGVAAFIVENALTLGIGLAIAAIIVAIYELITHWKEIWAKVVEIATTAWQNFQAGVHTIFDPVIAWIKAVIKPFVDFWNNHWQEISNIVRAVWLVMSTLIKTYLAVITAVIRVALPIIMDVIKVAWAYITTATKVAWDTIKTVVKLAWDFISTVFKVARDSIMLIVGVFLDLLSGHWGKAWDDIKHYAGKIWGDIVSGVAGFGKHLVSGIINLVKDVYNAAKKIGEAIINGIADMIKHMAGAIGGALKGVLSHIPGAGLISHVPVIGGLFSGAHGGIVNFPKSGGPAILHGREAVLPLDDPARSAAILAQSGLMGTGGGGSSHGGAGGAAGGGVHIGHLELTVVSSEPEQAGEAVYATLTDAQFLSERG